MFKCQIKQYLKDEVDKFNPCSSNEIQELEDKLKIFLPKQYQDFLMLMGKGAGSFLQGDDCFYEQLFLIQDWARELLEENQFLHHLPDDAFVFFMHQGYQFSFFRLSEGNNPPIYSYCEGQKESNFIKTHETFVSFISTEIELFGKHRNCTAA